MKVTFGSVLHYDIELVLVHERLVILDNVWVSKRAENGYFIVGCFYVVSLKIYELITFIELELIFFRAYILLSMVLRIL